MKTIVVTGATSGIGLAIVKELVKRNDLVIALGRTDKSCSNAYEKVSGKKLDNLIYLSCDLSNREEINLVTDKIKILLDNKGLDVLINNAGLAAGKRLLNGEGIEMGFAVNHLAAFLITHNLLNDLRKKQGIVIATGSRSHYKSILDFDNLMLDRKYHILRSYGRSKLCNTIFTYEFNRRYSKDNMIAYCLDPGMVKTGIAGKRSNRFIDWVWSTYTRKGQEPYEVVKHYLALIDNPKHFEEPYYFKYGKFIEPSDYSKRTDIAKQLWEVSEKLLKIT